MTIQDDKLDDVSVLCDGCALGSNALDKLENVLRAFTVDDILPGGEFELVQEDLQGSLESLTVADVFAALQVWGKVKAILTPDEMRAIWKLARRSTLRKVG